MIGERDDDGNVINEPPSREGAVIAALRAALQPGARASLQLNNSQTTACGGVALSDRFLTRMEVLDAFNRLAHTETQQAAVLVLLHGQHQRMKDVCAQLNLTAEMVRQDEFAGLQQLIRWIWDDETYDSPIRVRIRLGHSLEPPPSRQPDYVRPSRGGQSTKINRRVALMMARA